MLCEIFPNNNTDMADYDLTEIIHEIIDEKNERSLIILCSSMIDDQLFSILHKFLLEVPEKKEDLIKGDNPLSTFSSRIKTLYRLGIIDEQFRKILDTVRSIRNSCAHQVVININKSPIRDHIKTIEQFFSEKDSHKIVGERFFNEETINNKNLKNLFVTILIILQSINKKIEKKEVETELINICNK